MNSSYFKSCTSKYCYPATSHLIVNAWTGGLSASLTIESRKMGKEVLINVLPISSAIRGGGEYEDLVH